ncbi:sll0787 family AIR synthase-like protein [Leptolyngbya sp. FACHB-261]|uniref:sll0787 family AIR synthase-like protein n=1 Tax=Leptolyngbya sp. FACHB-261 TaxID=2692806 RepID=UPI00168235D2|nr:sll0787 family AIR synthase-like protein [Leptolyngbya sp. FACHB-261]MBD2104180.1 sll0787 family AIR synthase-like protein [Leptolyngbya sp. FACHB-261]
MLLELANYWRGALGLLQKQDIQKVEHCLAQMVPQTEAKILLGDDCAAIPEGDGYLLLAAEGMWPLLVETEPWFAGWCSVQVNVSDIYAMGGRPLAVVDTLWSKSTSAAELVLKGMIAAAQTYGVPIVGGHTNLHSPYEALAVAILGRASRLLTSFNAQPGDTLLAAVDLRGQSHPQHPFWNASRGVEPARLRADLELLPLIAEAGWCDAGKDISMGGILGTLLMLLETSGCGAVLNLDQVPKPASLPLERWLLCFPSYGFLLSARPEQVTRIQEQFRQRDLVCEPIGQVQMAQQLVLQTGDEQMTFWDLAQVPFMGFSPK